MVIKKNGKNGNGDDIIKRRIKGRDAQKMRDTNAVLQAAERQYREGTRNRPRIGKK